ncbi:hypothetical protein PG994_003328 [Apiospora phragmitis]|uniref:Uncharacterized protein n=1 Tax=Apiospora phragmitis TaxID=2905665 RepID=A0ABR1W0H4_9PEZI
MCEKHYYYTQRGNQLQTEKEVKLCVNSHHCRPCRQTVDFHHNRDERRGTNPFPPSPPLSDTDFVYSGSEGERTHKRRSGAYYLAGSNGIEISRKPSQRRRSVVVEDPYRPVTPPMYYGTSPSRGEYSSPPRRPDVHIEISNARPSSHRSSSTSYHSSPNSSRAGTVGSSSVSSEEERLQKLEREMAKTKEALRRQQMKSKIDRQNEAIANRPAMPQAPPAPRPYRRGSVSIQPPVDQLNDAMKHVRVSNQTAEQMERERRRNERRVQEVLAQREEAAQRERLRARMERRNSTAVYDDTQYRRHY